MRFGVYDERPTKLGISGEIEGPAPIRNASRLEASDAAVEGDKMLQILKHPDAAKPEADQHKNFLWIPAFVTLSASIR